MTRDEIKQVLILGVTEKQGLKATELCNDFLDFLTDEQRHEVMRKDDHSIPDIIQELVDEGSLVEAEYVLPMMSYRAKSFLLPKGTKVKVLNAAKEEVAPLSNKEIKTLNRLVDPFVKGEHAENRPAAAGGIDRGMVITLSDGSRISVKLLEKNEDPE